MIDIVKKAKNFATVCHAGQTRKYTGEPYINHPLAVADLVRQTKLCTQEMIAAALLHDVVEDCGVTLTKIRDEFGYDVYRMLYFLTDKSKKEDGNRETRKLIDREHIADAPKSVKTIKLADLIDNSKTVVERDPGFAKIYMNEKRLLLMVLSDGDLGLFTMAVDIVEKYYLACGSNPHAEH